MNIINIIIGIAVIVVIWVIYTYNKFVRFVNRTKEAWADIDVQLKRRYDLIPNLVSTVKGYAKHEEGTLTKVTELRAKAMQGGSPEERGKSENLLTGALKSIFALAENYPDLKANQNFLELQRELSDTENKIQAARRFYNGNVRDLNTGLEVFPGNIIRSIFRFKKQDFFELEEAADVRESVKVNF
ncbi:MAG: LemA family protein [Patescibacteria group bacterium]